jgi:hypothetical protein
MIMRHGIGVPADVCGDMGIPLYSLFFSFVIYDKRKERIE